MTELLTDLLNAGLIDKLDGDDSRFTKIEQAAEALAQELRGNPPLLIRAVLAGLDPDIPCDDPAIGMAEQLLVAEWKSMRTVYTDYPVNLLRAILLEACHQVAEGANAAILWLTAADTLPFLRLGKDELVVRKVLEEWFLDTEKNFLFYMTIHNNPDQNFFEKLKLSKASEFESPKVNRTRLLNRIQAAVGPGNQGGQALPDANPHWSNSASHWSYAFAPRMEALLADEIDILASKFSDYQLKTVQYCFSEFSRAIEKVYMASQAEQMRLNALWWSEALYSSTLCYSYRELPESIATVVMALDLLNEVTKPTVASVGYLLAEAVNRLPEASFSRKLTLQALLELLAENRQFLPKECLDNLSQAPEKGRWSLRDLVVSVLLAKVQNVDEALKRTGVSGDYEMSLPTFAHAFFRQEQAVQLAGNRQ